jgi:hypothetical protein
LANSKIKAATGRLFLYPVKFFDFKDIDFMKFKITVLVFFAAAYSLYSLPQESLDSLNISRNTINRAGMLTLGTWAIGNIASGLFLRANTKGDAKYFHEMNAAWNVINLGLATAGYIGSLNLDIGLSLSETLSEQASIEKILLFNAGLDVGYVMAGFYLRERSKNVQNNRERLSGYGKSLILQGAFLFGFDVVMYLLHGQNSSRLKELLENVDVSLLPGILSLSLKF